MLNLAVKNRVDSGVIGQIVAKLIFREQKLKFQKHLKLVSPGFDEVEFGIIFYSKKWAPFERSSTVLWPSSKPLISSKPLLINTP